MSVYERQRAQQRRFTRTFQRRNRRESDIWGQAEALAAEKRESYLLHRNELHGHKIGVGPLYEQFIVVGVAQDMIHDYHTSPSFAEHVFEPTLFFQYPLTESTLASEATAFCFPNGAKLHFAPKTPSASNILQIVYKSTRGLRNQNSHIFVLNTLEGYIYGICLTTLNIVRNLSSQGTLQRNAAFSPLCYCFLTRNPYFDYFYDLLEGIIGLEHLRLMSGDICADLVKDFSVQEPEPVSPANAQKSKKNREAKTFVSTIAALDLNSARTSISDDSFDSGGRSEASRSFRSKTVSGEQWRKSVEPVENEPQTSLQDIAEEGYMKEIIEILEQLHKSPSAASETTSKLSFSTSDHLIRTEFVVPETSDIESNLLIRWSAPLLFGHLKPKMVAKMISNIMLERPAIVYCPDLRILSSIMLSVIPLLRPFFFRLPFIPILPSRLQSILEAPMPFLVGVTELNPEIMQTALKSGVVIVDTAAEKVIRPKKFQKHKLPQQRILLERLKPVLDGMQEERVKSDKGLMDHFADNIERIFRTHYEALFSRMSLYTITNTSDRLNPVAVFLKEMFLEEVVSPKEYAFMKLFLETQQFSEYCDRVLQEHVQKPRDGNSAS
eukprot:TRINITY_DN5865_c0_g1_i1.p1 TRINITY_DN5865_c0_g1~~TRINITY_DN5865_c0_g1_i1.p1  ORF type:complete len:609 (+),score=122.22 TRINITY_DN5865_c0_g1_i1:58-1884(+)